MRSSTWPALGHQSSAPGRDPEDRVESSGLRSDYEACGLCRRDCRASWSTPGVRKDYCTRGRRKGASDGRRKPASDLRNLANPQKWPRPHVSSEIAMPPHRRGNYRNTGEEFCKAQLALDNIIPCITLYKNERDRFSRSCDRGQVGSPAPQGLSGVGHLGCAMGRKALWVGNTSTTQERFRFAYFRRNGISAAQPIEDIGAVAQR